MKVKKLIFSLLVMSAFGCLGLVTAAEISADLNVGLIPDSLKKNAYAGGRMASTEIE